MTIHVHQLHFEGKNDFEKQFNICSDLFAKFMDERLTPQERDGAYDDWIAERWRLETGSY